jgi:hypothetical protein
MLWQVRNYLPVNVVLFNKYFFRQDDDVVLMSKLYKMIYGHL